MKNRLLLFTVLFTLTVNAQKNEVPLKTSSDSVKSSNYKIILYWGINYNNQTFRNLNNQLNSFGSLYNELPQSILSYNLGWMSERNLFITKSNLGFGLATKGNPEKKNSTLSYFTGSLDMGIKLLNNQHLTLYPFIGIGVAAFNATLNKDLSNINFNDILQNPSIQANTQPVKIANSFLNYRVGFEVNFLNKKNNEQAIALLAGYNGSFKNRPWKVNMEQQVNNAPVDGLSQFYAGINLLMQRRSSKK